MNAETVEILNLIGIACSILSLFVSLFVASKVVKISNNRSGYISATDNGQIKAGSGIYVGNQHSYQPDKDQ